MTNQRNCFAHITSVFSRASCLSLVTLRTRLSSFLILLLGMPFLVSANAAEVVDCNFKAPYEEGAAILGYEGVMACFNSVPFEAPDVTDAVAVLKASRNRSPLRNNYDAINGWKSSLITLEDGTYSSDFELQNALVLDHWAHENGHYFYLAPRCYSNIVNAFIPIDFGSMVHKGEQIVYIDGIPGLPDSVLSAYQNVVGFPLADLVGMRITTINGIDALEYLKDQANTNLTYDENEGSVLNFFFNELTYSIRRASTILPTDSEVILEVVSKSGKITESITLPWKFYFRRGDIENSNDLLTDSNEAFEQLCHEQNPLLSLPEDADLSPESLSRLGVRDIDKHIRDDRKERKNLVKKAKYTDVPASRGGFYEVPAGQRGKYLTKLGEGESIEAWQHKDKTTVIKLRDFVGFWGEDLQGFVDHACEESEKLIIDLTGNPGGFVAAYEWLANYLLPRTPGEAPWASINSYLFDPVKASQGIFDIDKSFDDNVSVPSILGFLGFDLSSCTSDGFGLEPGCKSLADTNESFESVDWFFGVHPETRGQVLEFVTPKFYVNSSPGLPVFGEPAPAISCPGKFTNENLILLTDGTNASAGYFFPALIKDHATLVSKGGVLGEGPGLGMARGGSVVQVSNIWAETQFGIDSGFGDFLVSELVLYQRAVDSTYEDRGSYLEAVQTDYRLHVDNAVQPELLVPIWASTDSPEMRGYIYTQVLKAVDKAN
ncbi:MAG: hypothetical protein V7742_22500 [Halioglobus sp.]